MRKIVFVLLAMAAVCMQGCSREQSCAMHVKIAPTITRITGLHFDAGDRIGLTITKNSAVFAGNVPMTYDGSVFTASGLVWYNDLNEKSTLTAYYPYLEQGQPAEFTIAPDQSAGCAASDLLAAVKADVTPASAAVGMVFHHLFSQLTIVVANTSQERVKSVMLGGFIPTAEVDYLGLKAVAKSGAVAAEVKAFEVTPDAAYRVVLVPQQGALTVTVITDDGKSHSKTLESALLESGKQYDMSMSVTDVDIDVTLSGDILDWIEGGMLGGANSSGGSDGAEKLIYQGEEYRIQEIGGKIWMTENLRYAPGGEVGNGGVWYPCRDSEACSDAAYILERGLLYDYATALAGAAKSADAPMQGICPPGWHIPSSDELQSLVNAGSTADMFLPLSGLWSAGLGKYQDESRGYLMGAELSADGNSVSCLKLSRSNPPVAAVTSIGNGLSLRCVRNDK